MEEADRDVVQVAVASKTNGATPLVIASKNGHLQTVEFLISELNADIEQVSHEGTLDACVESREALPPPPHAWHPFP